MNVSVPVQKAIIACNPTLEWIMLSKCLQHTIFKPILHLNEYGLEPSIHIGSVFFKISLKCRMISLLYFFCVFCAIFQKTKLTTLLVHYTLLSTNFFASLHSKSVYELFCRHCYAFHFLPQCSWSIKSVYLFLWKSIPP